MNQFTRYLLAYLLWIVSLALGVLIAITIRAAYQLAMAVTSTDRYVFRAVDNFSIVFLGLLLIGLLVFTESYYRTGVEKGKLLRRFGRLTAIQVGILVLMYVVTGWLATL